MSNKKLDCDELEKAAQQTIQDIRDPGDRGLVLAQLALVSAVREAADDICELLSAIAFGDEDEDEDEEEDGQKANPDGNDGPQGTFEEFDAGDQD